MILTVFNEIKLVSNKSESMWYTRTEGSVFANTMPYFEKQNQDNQSSPHLFSATVFLSLNIPLIDNKGLLQRRPHMDGPFQGCGSPSDAKASATAQTYLP